MPGNLPPRGGGGADTLLMADPLLHDLVKLCNAWGDSDIRSAEKMMWLAGNRMDSQRANFLRAHSSEPLLVWFASDGTEHTHRRTELVCLGGRLACRRLRQKHEFLVSRLFLVTAQSRLAVLPQPIVLNDKTVDSHSTAHRLVSPEPRLDGHTGIIISHGCWDGAVANGWRHVQLLSILFPPWATPGATPFHPHPSPIPNPTTQHDSGTSSIQSPYGPLCGWMRCVSCFPTGRGDHSGR